MPGLDDIAVDERDRYGDCVLQLAYVAGPRMRSKRFERRLGDGQFAAAQIVEQTAHEERQVDQAFSKGRNGHHGGGESEVEILPELAGRYVGAQIAVRSRDDPHVERSVLRAADAAHATALERAQEPRLQVERQLADLVEEQRAAVGPVRTRRRASPSLR